MDIVEMLLQASMVVQAVMLMLALMSVYVWIVLLAKLWQIRKLHKKSTLFKKAFDNSTDLAKLYNDIVSETKYNKSHGAPLQLIFMDGFAEFSRQVRVTGMEHAVAIKTIESRMWQTYYQQIDIIEQRTSTLATIGSSAPYIGLFGTVWGIINAFQGLAQVQHATLALVAPGISEALIATAMGLFVAIPAVMGYNRLQVTTQRLCHYYENFMDTFSRLIERHLVSKGKSSTKVSDRQSTAYASQTGGLL